MTIHSVDLSQIEDSQAYAADLSPDENGMGHFCMQSIDMPFVGTQHDRSTAVEPYKFGGFLLVVETLDPIPAAIP